jgi:polyisoprenoid-binding protein YceI
MNRLTLPAGLAALAVALPALAEPESFTVDPNHTFPAYEVSHFGYSLQRGRFNKTGGKIMFDEAAGKCSADVSIDTASVSSGVAKLDEHLKSEDFFNAAKSPQITFKSTACSVDGGKVKSVAGDLMMNGVTRPVTLAANYFNCGNHPIMKKKVCGADFETVVKRTDFGMKYGIPVLGDDVRLRINVEAIKD